MGIQETLLGSPGQTQVHQTGATRPPGYHMAQDVYRTLEQLMNSGTPFPTYQGNIDPGLSPTLQNALRMAQGYSQSSPQEALAGINGSLGRFMNPSYSNPSGSSGSGLGGSMPFSGQFRPNAPTYNGGRVGSYDFKGGGGMPSGDASWGGPPSGGAPSPWAPPTQRNPGNGGMMDPGPGVGGGPNTWFHPNPGAGGGGSLGGVMGPNNPGKPNPIQGQQGGGGGGWGPAGGQSPPWVPPTLSGPPMNAWSGGNKIGLDQGPPGGYPYGNDARPMQIPNAPGSRNGRYPNPRQPQTPPQGGVPTLSYPGGGMPYGNDGRPMQIPGNGGISVDPIPGYQPPTPQPTQNQYPGGDLLSYLRMFLQGQGGGQQGQTMAPWVTAGG